MAASEMRRWLLLGLIALTPVAALAQSAGEVERCFLRIPAGSCSSSGGLRRVATGAAPGLPCADRKGAAPAGPAQGDPTTLPC